MKYETIDQYYEEARKRSSEWYKNNKDRKKEYQKKRYMEKREEILARNREAYRNKKNITETL